jgi:hypothetical protein
MVDMFIAAVKRDNFVFLFEHLETDRAVSGVVEEDSLQLLLLPLQEHLLLELLPLQLLLRLLFKVLALASEGEGEIG